MAQLFTYRDGELYSHHTLDETPNSEAFTMHAHEWMEVFYFLSGDASYLVEGTLYPLHPHDILITRSAETHTPIVAADAPYERIVLHFSPGLVRQFDPELTLLAPFMDRRLGRHNLYPASADPEGRLRGAFAGFSFEGVEEVRLNLIARLLLFLTTLKGMQGSDTRLHAPAQGMQSRVVRYVNEHLFEDLSLQAVADHFYCSRSQISRVFQQATGSSLWAYVTIKRLLAARAMIQRGESAAAAGLKCGFSDYSSFYRAYQKQFHHSPRADASLAGQEPLF